MISIEENKQRFIELMREVQRPDARIDALLYKLETSDFYVAPCSTRFHLNVKGGLCQHSLNVFEVLNTLCDTYCPDIPREVRIVVALCHDLDKMNKYEKTSRNTKHYHPKGTKTDELGRYDWVAEIGYQVKPETDRFVYGHHGQNSEYITNSYIPLNIEESAAISNHMGGLDINIPDITPIYNRYPIAALLHAADFISTFLCENK